MERKHPEAWKRFDELKEKYDSHSIEKNQKYEPIDKDTLREELKLFMTDRDLTIQDVADRIKRNPRTVWQFLNEKVKHHDRTTYRIRELLSRR